MFKHLPLNTSTQNKNLDVLIVEDELDICYLLTGILKRRNLNIFHVTTLVAAQKQLSTLNPDILIIDNHLPDGYGVDFISEVKQNYPLIKIVMITAYDTRDDKNKAIKQGADYFIGKPFTSNKIIETVDLLLKNR
jgi:two-component system OmpR family response regulator